MEKGLTGEKAEEWTREAQNKSKKDTTGKEIKKGGNRVIVKRKLLAQKFQTVGDIIHIERCPGIPQGQLTKTKTKISFLFFRKISIIYQLTDDIRQSPFLLSQNMTVHIPGSIFSAAQNDKDGFAAQNDKDGF